MRKILLLGACVAIFSYGVYFISKIEVASAGLGLPFGGRIVFVLPCTNGLMVVVASVDPKSVGPYIITPATIPHFSYTPFVGHLIKGSYVPGVPCYIPPAIVIPTKGAVSEFGTSLVPIPGI